MITGFRPPRRPQPPAPSAEAIAAAVAAEPAVTQPPAKPRPAAIQGYGHDLADRWGETFGVPFSDLY